jgi:fumarate hydratase class II
LEIAADALWGAQTARSLHFFAMGTQRMPVETIHAVALIK